ncbi:MAG: hypothetical protein SF053_14875 [Bacteroidia bacterium]|nr:hypothetical protein [Bacteroidia bacterium]
MRIFLSLVLSSICTVVLAGPPDTAQRVYTGIYLMNVYDLDLSEHSFHADFYLWFRWKGDRDPSDIEFVNAVEKWSITETPFYDSTLVLEDGWSYAGRRIEGRFYHPFELGGFPLDRHHLMVQIENTAFPIDSLIYVPDQQAQLYRAGMGLPGWDMTGVSVQSHQNRYETNFGRTDEQPATYSNYTLQLTLARPVTYFLLKLMLPLLVVIIACLGSLVIWPQYIDARISMPVSGLLTAVFLQQAYSAALPDVGYMVLMDKIYLMSYLLIALVTFRIVVAGNQIKSQPGDTVLRQIWQRDIRLTWMLSLGFVLATALLVLSA